MSKPYHELRDEEKRPVNLDAGDNGDWAKRTWDLGPARSIEHVLFSIIAGGFPKTKGVVQQRLDLFMQGPSGQAMPQAHRARLRRLGYRVP